MERLSKLFVLTSLVAAGGAHAWLVYPLTPSLPAAAGIAFIAAFLVTRKSLPLGLTPGLALTFCAPAVLMVAFGSTEYHLLLVWLALMAGSICAATDVARWAYPAGSKLPLVCWALVIAVSWPITTAREVDFSLVAARTLDTPNGLLAGPPPYMASWITSVAMGQLVGLLFLDLLYARFGGDRLRRAERAVFGLLALSITLSAVAAGYQEFVDINWLNVGDWPSLDRASGLMMDANSMGTAAAIWTPLALLLARRLGKPMIVAVPFVLLLAIGVWASGSRTALLILVVGAAGVGLGFSRGMRSWKARLVPIALLLAAAGAVLIVAINSSDPTNPVTRLVQTLPRPEPAALYSELWVRNGYGTAAVQAFREHPWTGVGIGGFTSLSTDYSVLVNGRLIQPDNAQNWWRHQLVELGVIGAAPSIWFSLLVITAIVRRRVADTHHDAGVVLRSVLIGVGLASLLGVSTQHPALFLTFVLVVFWLGTLPNAVTEPAAAYPGPRTRAWVVMLTVPAAVIVGQLLSATGDLRVPLRATRVGFPYAYGFSAPFSDPQLGDVRWTGERAVAVIRAEHAFFAVTLVTPHDDAATNPVRVRLWRGTELVADIESRSTAPVTRILRMPEGQQFLMFEVRASREAEDGRALKIAGRWLRELPLDAEPQTVVP